MKPPHTDLKRGRREGENGNIMEGVNLSKVYYTYVWN
jgi:hypothetical protein